MDAFVALAVGNAVSLDVGIGVTVEVGWYVALGLVGLGVALCTNTTGSGSAVTLADGLQLASRNTSAMGNRLRASGRIPIRFMSRERWACFIPSSYAIIMGVRALEENCSDED